MREEGICLVHIHVVRHVLKAVGQTNGHCNLVPVCLNALAPLAIIMI